MSIAPQVPNEPEKVDFEPVLVQPVEKKKSNSIVIILVLINIILLGVIAYLFYLLEQERANDQDTGEKVNTTVTVTPSAASETSLTPTESGPSITATVVPTINLSTLGWQELTLGSKPFTFKMPSDWTLEEDADNYTTLRSPKLTEDLCNNSNYSFEYRVHFAAGTNDNLVVNFPDYSRDTAKDKVVSINGKNVNLSYFYRSTTGDYTGKTGYKLTQMVYDYAVIYDNYLIDFRGNTGTIKQSDGTYVMTCEPDQAQWTQALKILETVSIK